MKNKGFTLIELLAIIVILAIIALIATPIILNIIEDAKEESNQRSMELFGSTVENEIATFELKNNKKLKKEEFSDFVNKMKNNGAKVECDKKELYEDGTYYLGQCSINGSEKKYSYGNKQSYENGEIVYFDVKEGKSCTNYHEDNSKTGYNGINGTGNQNSCLKFYAFNDNVGIKLNLLLDHNTTDQVAWTNSSKYSGHEGPKDVISYLNKDTKDWIGTEKPNDYNLNCSYYEGQYTIDYSNYKARLITANEIAQITGANQVNNLNWSETSESSKWYYFDGKKGQDTKWQTQIANSTNKSNYYWLFDRTDGCIEYGCQETDSLTNGYWTSSAVVRNSHYAWIVNNRGNISFYSVDYSDYKNDSSNYGVRPVIEVLKSKLK